MTTLSLNVNYENRTLVATETDRLGRRRIVFQFYVENNEVAAISGNNAVVTRPLSWLKNSVTTPRTAEEFLGKVFTAAGGKYTRDLELLKTYKSWVDRV